MGHETVRILHLDLVDFDQQHRDLPLEALGAEAGLGKTQQPLEFVLQHEAFVGQAFDPLDQIFDRGLVILAVPHLVVLAVLVDVGLAAVVVAVVGGRLVHPLVAIVGHVREGGRAGDEGGGEREGGDGLHGCVPSWVGVAWVPAIRCFEGCGRNDAFVSSPLARRSANSHRPSGGVKRSNFAELRPTAAK